MNPFVERLKHLCRTHPTRSKWVFVPTHALGRTLGDRLVLEGTDWANLRFVTPLDIALRMGAPFLVERGIDPSEEGLGPALIMRLLLELPERTGHFRPLASQPQMAVALWSTIRELRMAGVRSADLRAEAFVSAEKGAEVRALLDRYEMFLRETGRGDTATVFEEALQHPDWCPIQAQDCWTELPDVPWSFLQRRLIDAMPGERVVPEALALPGATMPRRLAEARVSRVEPEASAPLAFLMAPDRVPSRAPAPERPAPAFFHAGGAEAEVDEVFRRIVSAGAHLDQVEIVCASSHYTTLVWEKACRYEWPATIAGGVPATLTRPGRALLGLADWIDDEFAAGRFRRLLQSGDVALPKTLDISAGRAANLIARAEAAWGRETYRRSLTRLAKSSRVRAEHPDTAAHERERLDGRATAAEALAQWIQTWIDAIPAPDESAQIEFQPLVECAASFVETCSGRASALDAAAAARLVSAIHELRALGAFRCSMAPALGFLRERVEDLAVGADRARPGHLHVTSLGHAAFSARPYIFIVGLEEGRVFPATFEDPVLLDGERARISPALARSSDRTDEAVFQAIGRLAAASARPDGHLCLSYSCRDLREFRETYASWLMLQAYRVASGQPKASYRDMKDALGTPKSSVPSAADPILDLSGWWLRGIVPAGIAGRRSVLAQYPSLAAGVHAVAARESDRFTEFDGFVPEAGRVLDPAAPDRVVSATQLEDAAECPFRYFLQRALRVQASDAGERDREAWLDPLVRGSLLHELYATYVRRLRAERRRPIEEDEAWLTAAAREMLADLKAEAPPPSIEVEERETRELLDDLALFVTEERDQAASRVAVGCEVSFGRAGGGAEEPLSHEAPLVVDLGGGLRLRVTGRIDRIDQLNENSFEIVDYKTGRFWADGWKGIFAGGRRLQHALYGLAAADLLRRKYKKVGAVGAQYYFPATKGRQKRLPYAPISQASAVRVLSDLRDVIAQGLFVHAQDDGDCRFCDYGAACLKGAANLAKNKLADGRLEPYRRLSAHE